MEKYPEEYEALIEAIEWGPNPSSPEEITGARFDLFSRVNNIGELNGFNPQDINRHNGFIGGLLLITGMAPKTNLGDEDKIGILQATAEYLDRTGRYRKTGRSLVVSKLKEGENIIFRNQNSPASIKGLCANLYDTRLLAVRNIPRRPASQIIDQWLGLTIDRIVDDEMRQNLDRFIGVASVVAGQQSTMRDMGISYDGSGYDRL